MERGWPSYFARQRLRTWRPRYQRGIEYWMPNERSVVELDQQGLLGHHLQKIDDFDEETGPYSA